MQTDVRLKRLRRKVPPWMVLPGVLVLGVAILLTAHFSRLDYPTGVLLWVLGALAAAWLAASQPALVLALVLMLSWSASESFGAGRNPHFWFLLPWGLTLVLAWRRRWFPALRVVFWVLLGWSLTLVAAGSFLGRDWIGGERMALWQMYVFAGIALYIVARGLSWSARWAPFTPPAVTAGALLSSAALFALSFPGLHRFGVSTSFEPILSRLWVAPTLALLVLVTVLMVWRYHDTRLSTLPWYRRAAFVWLVLAGMLALSNLVFAGALGVWAALGYNLLALAGVVWLVMTGIERREPRLVDLGAGFVALLVLARYVDTFRMFLDREWFFLFGLVLLLCVGAMFVRLRRKIGRAHV